jgi:hypothetical protein
MEIHQGTDYRLFRGLITNNDIVGVLSWAGKDATTRVFRPSAGQVFTREELLYIAECVKPDK